MSPSTIAREMLPSVLPLGLGWAVARWAGGVPGGLRPFLRYLLLPILLFSALLGAFEHSSTWQMLLVGVGLGALGIAAVRYLPVGKTALDPSVALPSLAVFAIPVLGFTFDLKETAARMAALLFVAVGIVWIVADSPARSPARLIREPWVWAAVTALVFDVLKLSTGELLGFIGPLAVATPSIMLLFLGAALQGVKMADFQDVSVWLNVGARYAVGGVIAFLAIIIFGLRGSTREAMIILALAPPATAALALVGDQEVGSRRVAAVGTLASVVAMIVVLVVESR